MKEKVIKPPQRTHNSYTIESNKEWRLHAFYLIFLINIILIVPSVITCLYYPILTIPFIMFHLIVFYGCSRLVYSFENRVVVIKNNETDRILNELYYPCRVRKSFLAAEIAYRIEQYDKNGWDSTPLLNVLRTVIIEDHKNSRYF